MTTIRNLSAENSTNGNDAFVTPPTSPRRRKSIDQMDKASKSLVISKSSLPFPNRRKRRSEPSIVSKPRKISRHDSERDGGSKSSHLDPMIAQAEILSGWDRTATSPNPSISSSTIAISPTETSLNSSFNLISRTTSFEPSPHQTESMINEPQVTKALSRSSSKKLSSGSLQGLPAVLGKADPAMDVESYAIPTSRNMATPVSATTLRPISEATLEFLRKLKSTTPFTSGQLAKQGRVPFRQIYEVERIAKACKIDISTLSHHLKKSNDDYSTLWNSLCRDLKARGLHPPERSSNMAWEKAQKQFQGVSLSARLSFDTAPNTFLDLKFLPLKVEPTYRLSRHFGGDRFCVVAVPGLGKECLPPHLKAHADSFRDAFVYWIVHERHQMLGRVWRAFCVKPESIKKSQNRGRNLFNAKFRIYLFAEDGAKFRYTKSLPKVPGEIDPRTSWVLDRQCLKVQDMLEWLMPFRQNQEKLILKFFARLSLGLSPTIKTVQFKPIQIFRSDDAYANFPCERRLDIRRSDSKKMGSNPSKNDYVVMNDGCARISQRAATHIATLLNLDSIPSVFQGRIGGAKGVWLIDVLDEVPNQKDKDGPLWIEVTDSQLKFEASPIDSICPDPDRVTFEVIAWSKPLSSGHLNYQLLPILQDRGVPREVFKKLLTEDLYKRTTELEAAMEDGLALRKWCQSNYPTTTDRLRCKGIETLGGLPDLQSERIIWFIDHGFQPKSCKFLQQLLFQVIKDYCSRLETRLKIGLELSTNAFMIADPLNVLNVDEVHIGFSGTFKDGQGFDQSMLHEVDVLVARLPALLPSDIQKVRAVFKPELRVYRDVIVFSSRGRVPLANKLSGGDYDGDKAWICWEPSIVQHFQNKEVPEHPSSTFYGIEKDPTKVSDILNHPDYIERFLQHAFDFNLQSDLLGIITHYHESMCYARNNIDSSEAIYIAVLLGLLVDSSKAGFQFSDSKWGMYRKKRKLPMEFPKPAYKDKRASKPKDNLIDDLVFGVAKKVRERALANFHQKFNENTTRWDEDLVRMYRKETEANKSKPLLAKILTEYLNALDQIVDYWNIHCSQNDDDENNLRRDAKRQKAAEPSFKMIVAKCREDFLNFPPSTSELSRVVRRWIEEYRSGTSNYWDLLKASAAAYKYPNSKCIWYAAGMELGDLKATAHGKGTYSTIVNNIFETLKLDLRLVDARRAEDDNEYQMMAMDVDERDALADEDDFGDWDWEDESNL